MLAVINTFVAPVYKTPESGILIDQVLFGMTVTIQQEYNNFLLITTEYHYTGWIPKDTVCYFQAEQWKMQAKAQVITNTAHILQDAKVQSPILISVPKGSRLILLQQKYKEWVQVKLPDNNIGWILQDSVQCEVLNPLFIKEAVLRENICQTAISYLGTSYLWGGKTCLGIDCSGLVFMAFLMNGVTIYRDAILKEDFALQPIPPELIKAGDALFFPGHVALYLGEGKIIHATAQIHHAECCIQSILPQDKNFRSDLAKNILCAGTIFPICEK